MSDIFLDFCNICCGYINENNKINDNFEPCIFFSNETFFDILFSYYSKKYIVYYNSKYISVDLLKPLLFERDFIFKSKFSNKYKKNYVFVKDDNEINFIEYSILKTDLNPYKNVFLDIKTNDMIIKYSHGFEKIENLNDYFRNNIDNCKKLINNKEEYLFDFIYIFLRWNETTCFEIINSIIDSYNNTKNKIVKNSKFKIKNNKLKDENILFFNYNNEDILNFLYKIGELNSEKIKLFAKLMETKFHIFNKIFYNTNQIRYYDCQVSNIRIYMKFIIFARYIKFDDLKKNYFKNISINEDNFISHIKIPIYNTDSLYLNKNSNYSIIERLNKIDYISNSSKDINNIDFISKIKNTALKKSVSSFYQIAQAFFYIDEYKDDIETLKYAFICKKSQLLCYDDFCENIEILNSICKRLGFKNSISDSNYIYEMNKQNIAHKYQIVCNKNIPQIVKSKNKMLDIYEYQKCYYLLLEELYLNKYKFQKSEYNNSQNNDINEQIYGQIMEILVKRIIEEKEEKKRYLKTGIKNITTITTSLFDNSNYFENNNTNNNNDDNDEIFYNKLNNIILNNKIETDSENKLVINNNNISDNNFDIDFDKDFDINFDEDFDEDDNKINGSNFIIEPIFDNFFKGLVDDEIKLNSPYGSPETNQHKSASFDLIKNEIDNNKVQLDKEYDLEILENNVNELKNENINIKNKTKLVKLQIITKLSEMSNFEIRLLEGIDIEHMEDDKINEILDFYKLM